MKRYTIINNFTGAIQELDWLNEVHDGNHTMNDLYEHRGILFAIICQAYKDKAHLTFKHEDKEMPEGKFYAWVDTPAGPYGYHYKIEMLPLFEGIKEEPVEDCYDGFTSKDIDRLLSLGD